MSRGVPLSENDWCFFTDDIIKLNKKQGRGGSNRGGRGRNRGGRGQGQRGQGRRGQGQRGGRGQGQGGRGGFSNRGGARRGNVNRGGTGRGRGMGQGSGRGGGGMRGFRGGNSVVDRVKGKGPNKYKQLRTNLMRKKQSRGGMGVSPLNRVNFNQVYCGYDCIHIFLWKELNCFTFLPLPNSTKHAKFKQDCENYESDLFPEKLLYNVFGT